MNDWTSASAERPDIETRAVPARATVLLADDQPLLRELFGEILADSGYAVLAAGDGHEALAAVERHGQPIDLLITDVLMPGMSGVELVGRLAASQPGLKVVYMTGEADELLAADSAAVKPLAVLRKPFDALTFAQAVDEILSAR